MAGGSYGLAPYSDDELLPLLEEALAALAEDDSTLKVRLIGAWQRRGGAIPRETEGMR